MRCREQCLCDHHLAVRRRQWDSGQSLRVFFSQVSAGEQAGSSADDSNYTITINYTSSMTSDRPRSGLSASNTGGDPPSYAYSGQSFGACSYTACPIPADVESVYTYEFRTLTSVSRRGGDGGASG